MTTIEGNKLIAEFMGLEIITDDISWFDTNYKPLQNYHSDWNCLMPVIEKINSLTVDDKKVDFQIQRGYVMIKHGFSLLIDVENELLISAIYDACVEFIEWYNKQK